MTDPTPVAEHSTMTQDKLKVERVTDEMQAAWVDYDPAIPIEADMTLPRVSGATRHAYYAGWIASRKAAMIEAAVAVDAFILVHTNDPELAKAAGDHLRQASEASQ